MHLLRTTHRALYDTCSPSYLTLQSRQTTMHESTLVCFTRNWLCLLKQEHFKIQLLNYLTIYQMTSNLRLMLKHLGGKFLSF